MKTMYLFRHGDTVDAGTGPDYSRILTEDGRRQNGIMAAELKKNVTNFDLIVTSGALRAAETARIAAEIFEYPAAEIQTDDILYTSKKAEDILQLVWELPDDSASVMIVGHNPLLSDFITLISASFAGISMGKSSAVRLEFNTDRWSGIMPHSGKIVFYKTFEKESIVDVMLNVQL